MRRLVAGLALFVALGALGEMPAGAHAALRGSDPQADGHLEAAPTAVRLSFSERPEPSLSTIRVVDATGAAFEVAPPRAAPDDPLALVVALRPLAQRVYTVTWRVVSGVDGHPTAGAYTFGVGVAPSPSDQAVAARTRGPSPSRTEAVGRGVLLFGLLVLIAAACVSAAALALTGWAAAVLGLLLLAAAQTHTANASWAEVAATPVGRALAWRAAGLGLAGAMLALARGASPSLRRVAMWTSAAAACGVVGVHVATGHAAGAHVNRWASVAAQWAHVVAAAAWVGGLVALLVQTRGAPSEEKAVAVRRFSTRALVAVGVVVATGVVRALDEVATWRQLGSTGYGRTVVAKSVAFIGMVVFGALNRRRSIPVAVKTLRPLRRRSAGELSLAAVAVMAAAVLAILPPPADGVAPPPGLAVEGVDFARSVRVRLAAPSALPGPNRFTVRATDADSRAPLRLDRVTLRFHPLDDPGEVPTTLALEPGPDGTYRGSGANLSFDGRWRITVLVERGPSSVSVPLEVTVRGAAQFLSVERVPGRPVRYLVELPGGGTVRLWADPGRSGRNQVHAVFLDDFDEERPVDRVVITATTTGTADTTRLVVRRIGRGRFVADATLAHDRAIIAVVARADGARLRASVDHHAS